MSWTHYFEEEEAVKYGLNEAIVLNHIRQWIRKNEANGENKYEGRTWTYNSVKAWQVLLPFLTPKQLRTALEKLLSAGVLIKGNFNKNKYDRTLWYSIPHEEQIDLPPRANKLAVQGEPIPSSPPPSLHILEDIPVPPAATPDDKPPKRQKKLTDPTLKPLVQYYYDKHKEIRGFEVMEAWPRDMKLMQRIRTGYKPEAIRQLLDMFFAWKGRSNFTFKAFYDKVDTLYGVLKDKAEGKR